MVHFLKTISCSSLCDSSLGAMYYFANAPRFAEKGFVPTKDDILHARRKTTGILETVSCLE